MTEMIVPPSRLFCALPPICLLCRSLFDRWGRGVWAEGGVRTSQSAHMRTSTVWWENEKWKEEEGSQVMSL